MGTTLRNNIAQKLELLKEAEKLLIPGGYFVWRLFLFNVV